MQEFTQKAKGRKTPFSVDEIERKFNIDREKKNQRPVCFSNMERLIVVSLLLKVKGMKRSYEPMKGVGYRELFRFEETIKEEKLVCR